MIDLDRCRKFAGELGYLVAPEDSRRKSDVGTLAQLRRGLGKNYGEAASRDGWVLHVLDKLRGDDEPVVTWNDHEIEWACCVASLFAAHRGKSSARFGAALRKLWQSRDEAASVSRRFAILMDADDRDLGTHLRHAVRLLKSEDIGLDWGLLLFDVTRWIDPDHSVQRRWSRDFWLEVPLKQLRKPTPQK